MSGTKCKEYRLIRTSPYLDERIDRRNGICRMQVAFTDIVSYSRRKTYAQVQVIQAFMRALEDALSETARDVIDYANTNDVNIRRDVVLIPCGDGAALAFPFDGLHGLHLRFALHLLRIVRERNDGYGCDIFRENNWCDCHAAFLLRCGLAEGTTVLYRDINGAYNIAGDTVNMAARAMQSAGEGHIFLTDRGFEELTELVHGTQDRFRKYPDVVLKHNLRVDLYQYVEPGRIGLEISEARHLIPAAPAPVSVSARRSKSKRLAAPERVPAIASPGSPSSLASLLHGRMIPVEPAEFSFGSEQSRRTAMTLPRLFFIDKYPVTQSLYQTVINANPSRFPAEDRPVDSVSWIDAARFCNALSQMLDLPAVYDLSAKDAVINPHCGGFRLPSEAEWEYACSGGLPNEVYGVLDSVAWYNRNAEGTTHPVGQKLPNEIGMCDMLGNVWEWCEDWYEKHHPAQPLVDYRGPARGSERVIRGGSWADLPRSITARARYRKYPAAHENTLGFRIVRSS
jgi:formylglycine-generating enzyme required for sulfatase activity